VGIYRDRYHVSERISAFCRCGKPATHEVRNSRNEVIEWMCLKDATARCAKLNQEEGERAEAKQA
jgi:hypothetical protein